ncbi:hypothetical protein [Pedobacter duraquae]|uniref:Uncharacterized protein n=1 Tax=Pedobacter duraquae TaxID=425511 RepID=A0A4R6IIR2_9SPHI|nr:hypothetical protein [Pedobacter duraquae]TDO21879.1 hypothetical protein CLV32_2987 [Pedobacter duraquae]
MNQQKIQISLQEIEVKDLEEVVYQIDDLNTKVGNWIFTNANTIEVNDISRILHKGEAATVSEQELSEIAHIVSQHMYYKPFAKRQIDQYFIDKLIELKALENRENEDNEQTGS